MNLSLTKLGSRAIYKAIFIINDAKPLEFVNFINEMVKNSIDEYGTNDYKATFLYFNVFVGPIEIPFPIIKIIPASAVIKEIIKDKKENNNIVALTN